jgi:hypothetical protein
MQRQAASEELAAGVGAIDARVEHPQEGLVDQGGGLERAGSFADR